MCNFILASSSPRRLFLLKSIGYTPDKIVPADINEAPKSKELPAKLAQRLALEKAVKVYEQFPDSLILGADTIAARGRLIIPKPKNETEAFQYLKLLSGRRHVVYTAICIIKGGKHFKKVVQTKLKFKLLTNQEIDNLIASNEWKDKSGGYALQGVAGAYISWINGHTSNVIGLPLHETYKILSGIGLKQNIPAV